MSSLRWFLVEERWTWNKDHKSWYTQYMSLVSLIYIDTQAYIYHVPSKVAFRYTTGTESCLQNPDRKWTHHSCRYVLLFWVGSGWSSTISSPYIKLAASSLQRSTKIRFTYMALKRGVNTGWEIFKIPRGSSPRYLLWWSRVFPLRPNHQPTMIYELYPHLLVGGVPTPLKNMKVNGKVWLSHVLWKIKFMFQTTNQSVSICRWLNNLKIPMKTDYSRRTHQPTGRFSPALTPLRLFPAKHLSIGADDLPQAILGVSSNS